MGRPRLKASSFRLALCKYRKLSCDIHSRTRLCTRRQNSSTSTLPQLLPFQQRPRQRVFHSDLSLPALCLSTQRLRSLYRCAPVFHSSSSASPSLFSRHPLVLPQPSVASYYP